MAKEKRATWWKMFRHQRSTIEALDDADVGYGLKLAYKYFDGETVPLNVPQGAYVTLCCMRPYIDEAIRDFEGSRAAGKKGASVRWNKDSPPMGSDSPPTMKSDTTSL